MSNGHGGYATTRERDMLAYDTLHPRLREVVRRAPMSIAAAPLHTSMRNAGGDVETFRQELIGWIVRTMGRDCRRTCGREHPPAAARS